MQTIEMPDDDGVEHTPATARARRRRQMTRRVAAARARSTQRPLLVALCLLLVALHAADAATTLWAIHVCPVGRCAEGVAAAHLALAIGGVAGFLIWKAAVVLVSVALVWWASGYWVRAAPSVARTAALVIVAASYIAVAGFAVRNLLIVAHFLTSS